MDQKLTSLAQEMSSFFSSGKTKDWRFRKDQMRSLLTELERREKSCMEALWEDLRRPEFEAWVGELQPTLRDARYLIRSLRQLSKAKEVETPWWRVGHFFSRAEVSREAYGLSLIISPWNYPIQLALMPLFGSMAGGNVSILKPSEVSPYSSKLLRELCEAAVDPQFVRVVEGGKEVSQELLNIPFQKVFFTGSTELGREIYKKAAEHLASVSLELGGKCPSILMRSANFNRAIERILWAKAFNAGQTCVSPDTLYLPEERLSDLLRWGEKYSQNLKEHQARIINQTHFDRLKKLSDGLEINSWNPENRDELQIPLSFAVNPPAGHAIYEEEIFGPLLLVRTYKKEEEVFESLSRDSKPLSIYFFSNSKREIDEWRDKTSSGAFVVNDLMVHLTHPELPFGGYRSSGLGAYHGRYSFEAFTWPRAFEKRPLFDRWALRFPPYHQKWTRVFRNWI